MDTKTLVGRIPRVDSPLAREALLFVVAFLCGIVLLPLVIYAVGRLTLGAYANGGATALLGDFLGGLANGSPAFWAIALGPYAFIQLARLALRGLRRLG